MFFGGSALVFLKLYKNIPCFTVTPMTPRLILTIASQRISAYRIIDDKVPTVVRRYCDKYAAHSLLFQSASTRSTRMSILSIRIIRKQ